MGQVALGFKDLLIKAAVFVVMAALLAWILGGELLPSPERVDMAPVQFAGKAYFWQLSVGGRQRGRMSWRLMVAEDEKDSEPLDQMTWSEVAGPLVSSGSLYFGGLASPDGSPAWMLVRLTASGESTSFPVPDRLAVERQLARVRAGLPVQDLETIQLQRALVLDPPDVESADPQSQAE